MTTTWNVFPKIGVENVRFGSGPDEAKKEFGVPSSESATRTGHLELGYPGLILRYDKEQGALCEVTLVPEEDVAWLLDGRAVTWDRSFLYALCAASNRPEQWVGFVVLRDLGLAFSGFEEDDEGQLALTVFRDGYWDKYASHFKLFLYPAP